MVNAMHWPLYPQGRDLVHICVGVWVGPRVDLDRYGESRPPPGFSPQTVRPVVSRYTKGAIPALHEWNYTSLFLYVLATCTGALYLYREVTQS